MVCRNQKELYSLFFHAAAETVMELSENPARLGGTPGFISILHMRGSNLSCHPHVHMPCTGGGLDADRNWHQKQGGFFLPGKAVAALFKGKFLSGLKHLHDAGKLRFTGEAAKYRNHYEYKELLDICYGKAWVTDIRESFVGAESVMPLDGAEFVRRFLMHVPPRGVVRIRHYGLPSNANKGRLIPLCRNLIGCREFLRRFKGNDKAQAIRTLYKKDVTICPRCGGAMTYEVCARRGPHRSSA